VSRFALQTHHSRSIDDARGKGAGCVRQPALAVAAGLLVRHRSSHGSSLLTHTSGIPDYPDLGVDRPGVTNAEILVALRKVTIPVFPPGLKYRYSNSGYVLLGQIIESLAGATLPQFLADGIFKPLGMSSTFVLASPEDKRAGVARGYDRNGGRMTSKEWLLAKAVFIRPSMTF
jgi:CubicO group peptidase (beta-lactamase class C family)